MNTNSYELSKYRLEKAKEDLITAIENLANKHLSGSREHPRKDARVK